MSNFGKKSRSREENSTLDFSEPVSWGTKAKYVGAGIVIGVIVAPWVKKGLAKIQPQVDSWIDQLTGKTEEVAEKASDLLARAKHRFAAGQTQDAGHPSPHLHESGSHE
jgi:hypothetical protein